MSGTTWGVYSIQGKLPDGTHVAGNDRRATRWFVRWRVDNKEHKRTLTRKGHAKTFRERLLLAQLAGHAADTRGYPIDPRTVETRPDTVQDNDRYSARPPAEPAPSRSFSGYCLDTWWPNLAPTLGDRNRAGHRKNMHDAINWLRYRSSDVRVGTRHQTRPGDSILLAHLDSDDLKYALQRRRSHNDRAAAVNRRRLQTAIDSGAQVDIELIPELATDRTVQAFWVTLGMIIKSAAASHQTDIGSLAGAAALVPRTRTRTVSERIVPSIDEVFDLADAMAQLGPRMSDGHPTGERFRALVLAAGTLGARPGELVAHRPEWITVEDGLTLVTFRRTEGRFYDRQAGVRGRTVNSLKHRGPDDYRTVPALQDVADALNTHLERGYGLPDRTFASSNGRAHLDWANLNDAFWAPACQKVFANSRKPDLAAMPPKTLRKAAITYWLDSGISSSQAAEWAGHSEDVARRFYAGRVDLSFAREANLLARHASTATRNIGIQT